MPRSWVVSGQAPVTAPPPPPACRHGRSQTHACARVGVLPATAPSTPGTQHEPRSHACTHGSTHARTHAPMGARTHPPTHPPISTHPSTHQTATHPATCHLPPLWMYRLFPSVSMHRNTRPPHSRTHPPNNAPPTHPPTAVDVQHLFGAAAGDADVEGVVLLVVHAGVCGRVGADGVAPHLVRAARKGTVKSSARGHGVGAVDAHTSGGVNATPCRCKKGRGVRHLGAPRAWVHCGTTVTRTAALALTGPACPW